MLQGNEGLMAKEAQCMIAAKKGMAVVTQAMITMDINTWRARHLHLLYINGFLGTCHLSHGMSISPTETDE